MPDSHGGLVNAGTDFRYRSKRGVEVYSGLELTGYMVPVRVSDVYAAPIVAGYEDSPLPKAGSVWSGRVNQLYAGLGWKSLRLDVGMRNRSRDYGNLSLTGGNVVWSGNVRAMPGYNFQADWLEVPGTRGIWSVKANWSDYMPLDKRYVRNPLIHNKSLLFRFRLSGRVRLTLGLEHFAIWNGVSPVHGRQPHGLKNYLRIVCAGSGGSDATTSDRINVLGDHLGRELLRIDWRGNGFRMSFAHDIPFTDGSGMGFQNFPDGVNTVHFSSDRRDRLVTDVLYEFAYTKCQSGGRHDRPASPEELERHPDRPVIVMGGRDSYFNNGEYRSGWTYYGRTVGLPLFTPMPVNADGTTYGVANNRLVAHHVGIGGRIAHCVPYRLKATYSISDVPYGSVLPVMKTKPRQLSAGFEVSSPLLGKHFPVSVALGLYGDYGGLYLNNYGLTVRLRLCGRALHR